MTTIIERAIYNETHLPKTPSDIVSARKLRRANERVYIRKKLFELKGNVVALHGGHCVICGYDKNQAALEFHHVNAKEKEYADHRYITQKESMKCVLLCCRCHREHHRGGMEY